MKTLVFGSAIIDMRMKLHSLPKSGEDIFCTEAEMMVGGCAYNVAATLRNMDCEHDLCVPVGTGPYANTVSEELKRCGYKILIKDKDMDNGFCLALVEDGGERTFITLQGIESHFHKKWLESLDMSQYDKIYIAGYQVTDEEGGFQLAEWLSEHSAKKVFFAPGPVILNIPVKTMEKIFSVHPVLHLNEKEAMEYTGKNDIRLAAESLYSRTNELVIITLGAKGAAWYDGHELNVAASVKAAVVDTIGAGDSHIAAVMGCLSRGYGVEKSIRYANYIAAGVVGVQGPIMSKEQFDRRMEYFNG